MSNLSRVFTALAVLAAVTSSSVRAFARETCESHLLTDAQTTAIRAANRGDYMVTAVEGLVDGIPRTIVVMGETHVKRAADEVLGNAVVDAFRVVGVEGNESFKRTVIGRAYGAIAMNAYKIATYFGMKPSTILYATNQAKADPPQLSLFKLETGHVVGTKDKIKLFMVFGTAVPAMARAGAYLYPAYCGVADSITTLTFSGALLSFGWLFKIVPLLEGSAFFVARATGYEDFKEKLHHDALCASRDVTMSANVLEALRGDPTMRRALVIVGRDHLGGLNRHFMDAGFKLLSSEITYGP